MPPVQTCVLYIGQHFKFWSLVFSKYVKFKPPIDIVLKILQGAVEVESAFVNDIFQEDLKGLKKSDMIEHVKFVADIVMKECGYEPFYKVKKSPFEFMNMQGMRNKSNFFEKRVGEYATAPKGAALDEVIDLDGDF